MNPRWERWWYSPRDPYDSAPITIDESVIVPATPARTLDDYLDSPEKIVGWFGAAYDDDGSGLYISGPRGQCLHLATVTIDVDGERRFARLTGVLPTGLIEAYLTRRSVACTGDEGLGYGTEIAIHADLSSGTTPAIVQLLRALGRRGLWQMRAELGS